jgi:hypothetical protein
MVRLTRIVVLLSCLLLTGSAFATTYYIDYVSGNDSNNGTSKATPWKHAPGMQGSDGGCVSTCATAHPQAGDSVILKGGVTWPNSSLGWLWAFNGTGSSSTIGCTGSGCIYVGVDQSWYTGSSWNRPILDGGGSQVSPKGQGSGNGVFIRCYCKNVHFDNLEMKGLVFTGSNDNYGQDVYFSFPAGVTNVGQHVEASNFYIHGWSHTASNEHACAITGDTATPNNDTGSSFHDSIVDGSDTAKNSCSAVFGGVPYIYDNELTYVTSGAILSGTITFHDNVVSHVVSSFDGNAHLNGLEINGTNNVTIYNNLFAHMGSGALTIWCAPYQGYACYLFNNVVFDTDTGNILDPAAPIQNGTCAHGSTYCNNAGAWVAWNNTVECGQDVNPNASCIGINAAMSAVTLQNNHFITSQTGNNWWNTDGVAPTTIANVIQSKSTANGQGYTANQANGFSPTAASDATVSAGVSAAQLCANSGQAVCESTTSYGVLYNTSNHTVSLPALATQGWNTKPDVGAYQFSTSQVQAPTGLTAAVN